jgi:hypothetical protein
MGKPALRDRSSPESPRKYLTTDCFCGCKTVRPQLSRVLVGGAAIGAGVGRRRTSIRCRSSALGRWSARDRAGRQDRSADVLVMGIAGLNLLRDGMHVTEAALELVRLEYGSGAGHVIGGIDHRG